METHFTLDSLSSLETETQLLLRELSAKREEVQQGQRLHRLQHMLQELQVAANSIRGVLSDEDPIWGDIRKKQGEIERQLEDMAVAAPMSAINFAMDSLSQDDVLSPNYLLEESEPISSNLSFHSLDREPLADSSASSPSVFNLFGMGKRPLQVTLVVIVTIALTFVIGSLRVSQTQRLGPSGPFISNPATQ